MFNNKVLKVMSIVSVTLCDMTTLMFLMLVVRIPVVFAVILSGVVTSFIYLPLSGLMLTLFCDSDSCHNCKMWHCKRGE